MPSASCPKPVAPARFHAVPSREKTPAAEGPAVSGPHRDEGARRIRDGVRASSRALRRRHPVLDSAQSAIGLALQLFALAGMTGCAWLYARGSLPAAAVVVLAAFFASIAHEIEHDLIHKCYFPTRRRVADAMLAVGWLMRPSTINPWVRRRLHLAHHRISGTPGDVEERAITNGMPMGPRRLLVMVDGLFAGSLLREVPPGTRARTVARTSGAYFPLGFLHYGLLYLWCAVHGTSAVLAMAGVPLAAPAWMRGVDFLFVVWVAPNVLRTFALHFVSSNLHYYGDIAEGDVLRQVQVLDRAVFLPLQVFCANFGSTHAIHHFYVPDPFYMRQLTARDAHRLMRSEGVRFNDVASMTRANRYGSAIAAEQQAA